MAQMDGDLIDWTVYAETRSALGADFVRILGYFREDGTQSVVKIEKAIRESSAAEIIIAAHTLKGESAQFGAIQLSTLAEKIEMMARKCVEHREAPDEIIEIAAGLTPLFEQSLSLLDRESSPVVPRQPHGFGRRSTGFPAQAVNR